MVISLSPQNYPLDIAQGPGRGASVIERSGAVDVLSRIVRHRGGIPAGTAREGAPMSPMAGAVAVGPGSPAIARSGKGRGPEPALERRPRRPWRPGHAPPCRTPDKEVARRGQKKARLGRRAQTTLKEDGGWKEYISTLAFCKVLFYLYTPCRHLLGRPAPVTARTSPIR